MVQLNFKRKLSSNLLTQGRKIRGEVERDPKISERFDSSSEDLVNTFLVKSAGRHAFHGVYPSTDMSNTHLSTISPPSPTSLHPLHSISSPPSQGGDPKAPSNGASQRPSRSFVGARRRQAAPPRLPLLPQAWRKKLPQAFCQFLHCFPNWIYCIKINLT